VSGLAEVAVLWLLRSLLSTEMDVGLFVIAKSPVINTLVLSNLCEYRRKSYIDKNYIVHFCRRYYGSIFNHLDVIGPKETADSVK